MGGLARLGFVDWRLELEFGQIWLAGSRVLSEKALMVISGSAYRHYCRFI